MLRPGYRLQSPFMGTSSRTDLIRTFGRDLAQGLVQLFYPGLCGICGEALRPEQSSFCEPCRKELITDQHLSCPRCATTIGPYASGPDGCVHCRGERFPFERVLRLGPYQGLLRDVIIRLKRASGEMLAETLGDLWGEVAGQRLREVGAELVVPVPLHWWRRLVRGYNQTEALAQSLAARLRTPCRPGLLRRIRYTPSQTQQTATERRQAVRGAFRAQQRQALKNKTILLVDDVMTTGSTCRDAARALLDAGAARVAVAVLARSHPGA